MRLTFVKRIAIGDILTSVSVLLAALGLMTELSKERVLRQQQQANEIRAAAAKTIAALERWRELSFSFFDEIQPILVQTGESVRLQERSKKGDSVEFRARNLLYSKAYEYRASVQRRLADERIETAYVEMYRFHPTIKPFIDDVIERLKSAERASFLEFLDRAQFAIAFQAQPEPGGGQQDAHGGARSLQTNLRKVNSDLRAKYGQRTKEVLEPAEQFLSKLVLRSDSDLLVQSNLAVQPRQSSAAPSDPSRPDPRLTPGAARTANVDFICTPGFSRYLREESDVLRNQILREYRFVPGPGGYELDHLIPLDLGGADVAENLWPQAFDTEPWNAHVKDRLENRLHREVCAGKLDIGQAQRDIATDWIAAYRKYMP